MNAKEMLPSQACFDLIKSSEDFVPRALPDCLGYMTIGYGHKLIQPDSFPGGIGEALALHIMLCDADDAAQAVSRLVKVPLTQGQFDALTDFCFNIGEGDLAKSTLLKDLNAGKYDLAAEQLLRWAHGHKNGHVVELPGLRTRREKEYKLWYSGQEKAAEPEAGHG